jgi:hypothetical protein
MTCGEGRCYARSGQVIEKLIVERLPHRRERRRAWRAAQEAQMTDIVDLRMFRAIRVSREAAEADLNELGSTNLLLLSPQEQQEAIGRMRLLKASLAMLQREDVQRAILQRAAEIGGDVPTDECLEIVARLAPEALIVRLA